MSATKHRVDALKRRAELCLLRDRARFLRRLDGLRRRPDADPAVLDAIAAEIDAAESRRSQRWQARPTPKYDTDLPVVQAREQIAEAIRQHPVLILCGETGSGKTTQLPLICLDAGRGEFGLIGHTQPRRIAARSVAARIAEELGVETGSAVGYKVRFSDHTRADGLIKLMTDGILLAETQSDPRLLAYDTLIIDEAHERSLNIDFLLGYLHRLLPKRPDLKLIITSATIDPQRFAAHFGDAPIIEVSGRSYPVEVRYRPVQGDAEERDRDQQQAIVDAVDECAAEGPGDILVFLPGEREIRATAETLRKHHPKHSEILPLYGRLSTAEQNRVFKTGPLRRIVLATNVAETSLTVPGIRFVVDPGEARISRYSPRSQLQRLPVERISRASADQRKGRCGRLGPGICIRLYDEADYESRPAFTEPEILRTNLASVVLQMKAAQLGEPEHFPFVEPPERRAVNDGYRLLQELGALDDHRRLTEKGRQLARLPLDPRLGTMLLSAREHACLREALIIVSGLSVQDPRERPHAEQQAADASHEEWLDPKSDFLSLLGLWNWFAEQSEHLSQNQLRKTCKARFLSYLRLREWRETHLQLRLLTHDMQMRENETDADYPAIHKALLSGLLGNVAARVEPGEYQGARNRRLRIFPGSGLARRKREPRWLMAAEIAETSRVYARTVAAIEPEWIEQIGAHLLSRSYSEPRWEKRRAQVAADEKTTLHGLVINPKRRVNYGPIDPETSRRVFIRGALVEGHYNTRAGFFHHNRKLLEEVAGLEEKARRRDILVDEDTLFGFYDERVPTGIYNGPAFERWRRQVENEDPRLLYLTRAWLMRGSADDITAERFPERLEFDGFSLPLSYSFDPGGQADGISLRVPLALLNQVDGARCQWLVPGLLEELLTALIRALPKSERRHFVPAPDFGRAAAQSLEFAVGELGPALSRQLQRMTGHRLAPEDWPFAELPPHLRMRFEIVDEEGSIVDQDRDLGRLRRRLQADMERSLAAAPSTEFERDDVRDWDFGDLPETLEIEREGARIQAHPALVLRDEQVDLRLWASAARADHASRAGLLRLLQYRLREPIKYLRRGLPGMDALCLRFAMVADCDRLKQDLIDAALNELCIDGQPLPRTREDFEARLQTAQTGLVPRATEISTQLGPVLDLHHEIQRQIRGDLPLQRIEAARDLQDQMARLIYPGFILATPAAWRQHLPRYLQAAQRRLEALDQQPERDRLRRAEVQPLWEACKALLAAAPRDLPLPDGLVQLRWMIEELRVSLFAQALGTAIKVSAARVERELERLRQNPGLGVCE